MPFDEREVDSRPSISFGFRWTGMSDLRIAEVFVEPVH